MPSTTIARIRRSTLAAKIESTYGTSPFGGAPVAADLLPVENLAIEEPRAFYPRAAQSGILDAQAGVPGELMARVTFDIMLRGKGSAYAAGNKPDAGVILRALGFSEVVDTTVSAEKVTYKHPVAPEHESATLIFMQENAPSLTLLGGRGDASLIFVAGQPVALRATMMGIHGGRGTQALVTSQPAATPVHPILASAAFQVGTENYAAQFRNLAIALNNVLSPIAGPNDANAYAGYIISKDPTRPPTLSFDPEAVTAATFDWFAKWGAGTLVDWSFGTNGPQYTRIKFGDAGNNKAQIQALSWGERESFRTFPVVLNLLPNVGQDSLTIVFD